MLHKSIIAILMFVLIGINVKASEAEVRNLANFSSISIFGNLNVRLVKGDSTYVVLKGEKDFFSAVTTEVSKNKLSIKFTKTGDDKTIDAIIYYKSINEVVGKAGANIVANNVLDSPKFNLKLAQGSEAILEFSSSNVDIKVTQASELKIKGRSINLNIICNSGANVQALEMKSDKTIVKAVTGGVVAIKLEGDVTLTAHTGAVIAYSGTPKTISQKVSTGGKINKAN